MITSPILASLRCLPLLFRLDFKILLLLFQSLSGLAPSYSNALLTPYSLACFLTSTDLLLKLLVSRALQTEGGSDCGITFCLESTNNFLGPSLTWICCSQSSIISFVLFFTIFR